MGADKFPFFINSPDSFSAFHLRDLDIGIYSSHTGYLFNVFVDLLVADPCRQIKTGIQQFPDNPMNGDNYRFVCFASSDTYEITINVYIAKFRSGCSIS